jgi:hypothetical protein
LNAGAVYWNSQHCPNDRKHGGKITGGCLMRSDGKIAEISNGYIQNLTDHFEV